MKKANELKVGDTICFTIERVWCPCGSQSLTGVLFKRETELKEGVTHMGGYMIFNKDDELITKSGKI